jgi:hypothetical protein
MLGLPFFEKAKKIFPLVFQGLVTIIKTKSLQQLSFREYNDHA